MIPSIARIAAASCASACLLWGGVGIGIENSNAIDTIPVELEGTTKSTKTIRTTNTAALGLVFDGGESASVDAKLNSNARLQPCPSDSNCVSSNYLEPPNRYVSPLTTFRDRETAFARAVKALQDEESISTLKVVEILPRQFYIHATLPGTASGSNDDVEILFAENGNIVNLRCQARVTLPPPPFCLKKNCINGNMDQRTKIDGIARTLGLPPSDQQQMQSAKWTPIFFNSDRVPGFDDEY